MVSSGLNAETNDGPVDLHNTSYDYRKQITALLCINYCQFMKVALVRARFLRTGLTNTETKVVS